MQTTTSLINILLLRLIAQPQETRLSSGSFQSQLQLLPLLQSMVPILQQLQPMLPLLQQLPSLLSEIQEPQTLATLQ